MATVATAVLFDRVVNARPPAGAGALIVTVATEVPPLETLVGLKAMALTAGVTVTVRVADLVTAFAVAEIDPEVTAVTTDVAMGKSTVLAPAGTTTEAGTAAAALVLVVAAVNPPCGAGPVRVIVPVAPAAPTTLIGATTSF
ncbi:MAG TPA: hypothetical protein VFA79_15595, partial [Myxococcales bacterium]|nr:hypothetical protein [Myxococcales bacterium]